MFKLKSIVFKLNRIDTIDTVEEVFWEREERFLFCIYVSVLGFVFYQCVCVGVCVSVCVCFCVWVYMCVYLYL